ncbi:FkbM family methyltransferase [Draconibacterium sp.]
MSFTKKLKYKIFLKKDIKRRLQIIGNNKIDVLLDIGANTGQFAKKMRNLGYTKKIISFEPLKDAFKVLNGSVSNDKNWTAHNYAIGDEDITGVINVSGKSDCSSILNMLPSQMDSAAGLEYVAKQEIEIKKLDTIFDTLVSESDNIMMKIDTQGYEKNVIDGAIESLKKIRIIQLEMSIVPLYENEMLLVEMIKYIEDKGFQLYSLENGHYNRNTGQLLQVDGIFVNKKFV